MSEPWYGVRADLGNWELSLNGGQQVYRLHPFEDALLLDFIIEEGQPIRQGILRFDPVSHDRVVAWMRARHAWALERHRRAALPWPLRRVLDRWAPVQGAPLTPNSLSIIHTSVVALPN